MERTIAEKLKFATIKSKLRKARLSKIRGIVQMIPTKATLAIFDPYSTSFERGIEQGRIELANEIRAALNNDLFTGNKSGFRPGRGSSIWEPAEPLAQWEIELLEAARAETAAESA